MPHNEKDREGPDINVVNFAPIEAERRTTMRKQKKFAVMKEFMEDGSRKKLVVFYTETKDSRMFSMDMDASKIRNEYIVKVLEQYHFHDLTYHSDLDSRLDTVKSFQDAGATLVSPGATQSTTNQFQFAI